MKILNTAAAPQCYLCPGNSRANGSVNPDYNNIFVFENDYSAVKNRRESGVGPNEDPGMDL